MMRRDTYHDYITMRELRNVVGGSVALLAVEDERRGDLARRSGVYNTKSGRILSWWDEDRRIGNMEVRFDSRAWTGL